MEFGCCISIKNITKAKEIGYDFIELEGKEIAAIKDDEWKDVSDNILKNNIKVIGFNSFCDGDTPIVGNVNQNKLFEYSMKIVERGKDLNIANIGIGAPKARILPNGFDLNTANEQMEDFLFFITNEAKKYNINILLEALNPYKCNYITSTKEAYKMVNKLHIGNLFLVYDLYHSINSNETYKDVVNYFDKTKHVHISSWDKKDLSRFYLLEKDEKYIKDFIEFLRLNKYNSTVSIEASDINFNEVGELSLSLLKQMII